MLWVVRLCKATIACHAIEALRGNEAAPPPPKASPPHPPRPMVLLHLYCCCAKEGAPLELCAWPWLLCRVGAPARPGSMDSELHASYLDFLSDDLLAGMTNPAMEPGLLAAATAAEAGGSRAKRKVPGSQPAQVRRLRPWGGAAGRMWLIARGGRWPPARPLPCYTSGRAWSGWRGTRRKGAAGVCQSLVAIAHGPQIPGPHGDAWAPPPACAKACSGVAQQCSAPSSS